MTIERPAGGRKPDMTVPPSAWPMTDEDALSAHADQLSDLKNEIDDRLSSWHRIATSLFDGNTWFGAGASAAQARVQSAIRDLQSVSDALAAGQAFLLRAYQSVSGAKNQIVLLSDHAQGLIDSVASDESVEDSARETLIQQIVDIAFRANCAIVVDAASALSEGRAYEPSQDPTGIDGLGAPNLTPANGGGRWGGAQNLIRGDTRGSDTKHVAPNGGSGASNSASGNTSSLEQPAGPGGAIAAPEGATNSTSGGSAATPQPSTTTGRPPIDARSVSNVTHGGQSATPQPISNGVTVPGSQGGADTPFRTDAAPVGPTITSGSPTSSSPVGGSGGSASGGSGSASSSSGTQASSAATNQDAKPATGSKDTQPGQGTGGRSEAGAEPGRGASGGGAPDAAKAVEATNKSVPVAQQPITPSAASPLQPVTPPVIPTEPAASTHAPAGGSGGAIGGGMGGGAGTSGGGGAVGGGAPSGAAPASPPPPPMPLAPPSTPTPAAPTGPPGGGSGANPAAAAGPGGPGVHAASTGRNDAGAVGAAPVPVSTARMERDAIASASAGGAMNRKKNGNAALIMARRIAAALNIGVSDFGFYWVTGLTADGSIVVANSYGLAYIPDGVNLPAHVTMATADETLPPQERAKWATYPILAIQGWAQAHAQKLRAVIATEEQFASFDPGTAKIVLRPDDIPESGTMDGRSRLEVIAPNAAARLASVPNADLTELLPPAPANTAAPEDKSNVLWFELIKPLMSTSPERVGVHLQAFINYAEHAQEQALYRAHTAVDAEVQRVAIADWVYWQHLSVLMWEASGAEASV